MHEETDRVHLVGMHEPAKVSWEGTQLEVARGEKFCKGVWQIKMSILSRKRRPGRETGGLVISAKSRFAWRRAANATPAFVSIFFAACPLLIPGFSSASGCEVPTKVVSAMLGTSGQPQTVNTSEQPHEYKILLRPPNYENLLATQEHLVFTTVLTRMLFDEAASRSHRRCNIIASTSLFPNIRVVIRGSSEPQCSDTVRDILSSFTPSAELIGKIASSLAAEKKPMQPILPATCPKPKTF